MKKPFGRTICDQCSMILELRPKYYHVVTKKQKELDYCSHECAAKHCNLDSIKTYIEITNKGEDND